MRELSVLTPPWAQTQIALFRFQCAYAIKPPEKEMGELLFCCLPPFSSTKGSTSITVGPVSCIFSVTWSAGDVKEPTHLSKSVGDVVPGVVVYLWCHCFIVHFIHGLGGWVRSNMD